jgi:hypothetical protein
MIHTLLQLNTRFSPAAPGNRLNSMPPKTPRERADEKRQAKLDLIQQQIKDGSLTVRKMTPEEKKASESRERPEPRKQRRR